MRHLRAMSRATATVKCAGGLVLLMLIAGCTTGSRSTADSFRQLFERKVDATPEQVAASRYPLIRARTSDLSAVLVLGAVVEGIQTWYAGNYATFETSPEGLLLSTSSGTRRLSMRIVGTSPFNDLAAVTMPTSVLREFDWLPGYQMGIQMTGTLSPKSPERVEILGRTLQLNRFDEVIEGGGIRFTNVYWVDASGFIWKSTQHLAPDYQVELVQLKPYRPRKD